MNVENEVAALQQMTTGELCERYANVFGEEPRSRPSTGGRTRGRGSCRSMVSAVSLVVTRIRGDEWE